MGGSEKFRFGQFCLVPAERELLLNGVPVALGARAFDILLALVRRRGRLVTKDQLMADVWPHRVVEENNLQAQISAVRKALANYASYLQTVPGHGYRFVGAFEPIGPAEAIADAAPPGTAALPLPDRPSIAVLPFVSLSEVREQEYFADGIVEDIITALSRFKSLFVIARNSSFAYKGKSPDIRQVGRELGVRYVLEGSVRKAGGKLRITAQLIDTASGAHAWVDRFEGALEDVFAFQDEVTEKVVAAIAPRVERAEIARARRRSSGNADAYDCYLRGLACLYPVTPDSLEEALRHFANASALDPDYAAAYAMSMWCRANRPAFGLVPDIERERSEVTRLWRIVAQIGQEDGLAFSQAAWAVAYLLRDLASAKQLIDRAVELNPNLATAWVNSGWINVWRGHPDIALEHLVRAERLDPGERAPTWGPMAHAYFFLGRYEEAVALTEQLLRQGPDSHPALRIGAASAAFAGRKDMSRLMADHLQLVDPAFRVSRLAGYLGPYQTEYLAKYAEGLRKAGLPE
jgi:TolB-like protein